FGLKPMRTPEDEDFHDLIAERYERTSTVLTSNLLRGALRNKLVVMIVERASYRRLTSSNSKSAWRFEYER
ncbi:hypothetical protein QCE81_36975, partial [Caballeronia sp. LZ002]|nr:hypothetical protein [Caballeronia sp. LZ002]MDR5852823.1 hypothetical protein [Caballeronia sp. LZ003]